MNSNSTRSSSLFNSPLEVGLRLIILLNEMSPRNCDLQRLLIYDYLLVHSGDIPNGPASIHPKIPYRSNELLVRRQLLLNALSLMHSKDLLDVEFDSTGITYKSTDLTKPFLQYFESTYSRKLQDSANWVVQYFSQYTDIDLQYFVTKHLDKWGSEFSNEFLLRGASLDE